MLRISEPQRLLELVLLRSRVGSQESLMPILGPGTGSKACLQEAQGAMPCELLLTITKGNPVFPPLLPCSPRDPDLLQPG